MEQRVRRRHEYGVAGHDGRVPRVERFGVLAAQRAAVALAILFGERQRARATRRNSRMAFI